MQTIELVYGRTGQTVEFYPQECVRDCIGIPSSVTCSVYFGQDSNDDAVEFSPTVTVDSVSTTLSAAAGQTNSTNRSRITVASSSGITAGILYLLDSTLSQREVVEPKKINSTTIDLVHDLQYDYAITVSTLKGIRCTFTVDATWVTTESNILDPSEPSYRIRWQYTVGGTVYNHQTYLRLVRKPFKSSLTYLDVVGRWPSILDKQPREQRGEKLRRMIEAAEDTVRSDIIAEGYKPEQINDTENVDRLVNHALDHQIARFHSAPEGRDREAFIIECKQAYGEIFAKVISNLRVDLDTGVEGATTAQPEQRLFFAR